jgi:hypothetical protein
VVHLTYKVYQNGHYGVADYTLGNIFIWGVYSRWSRKLKWVGRICPFCLLPPPPALPCPVLVEVSGIATASALIASPIYLITAFILPALSPCQPVNPNPLP